MPTDRRSLRFGVALLEVIVAMLLLSLTGLTLFAWINQNLNTAGRLAERDAQARLTLNALALVENLNPAERPEGQVRTQGLAVAWQSAISQPFRRTQGPGEVPGLWWVALYKVEVTARTADDAPPVRFTVLRPGWQKQAPAVLAGS